MNSIPYDCIPSQLELLSNMKTRFDDYGLHGVKPFITAPIDGDDFYSWSVEALFDLDTLVFHDYDEGYEENIFIFSSKEMVKFYRLAYKIGDLSGWKDEKNPHVDSAISHDIERLRECGNGIYGTIYPNIRQKGYASSWYITLAPEFYDYLNLVFALTDIFARYTRKMLELQEIYNGLCLLTKKVNLEVAA